MTPCRHNTHTLAHIFKFQSKTVETTHNMLKCKNNSGDISSSSMWASSGGTTVFTRLLVIVQGSPRNLNMGTVLIVIVCLHSVIWLVLGEYMTILCDLKSSHYSRRSAGYKRYKLFEAYSKSVQNNTCGVIFVRELLNFFLWRWRESTTALPDHGFILSLFL